MAKRRAKAVGFDAFRQQLADMETRADDLAPIMDDIGEDIRLQIEHVFDSEGASNGRRWQPLAKGVVQRRIKKGQGTSILRYRSGKNSGALLRSFTTGRQGVYSVTRRSVEVGTKMGIAPIHHRGGSVTVRRGGNKGRSYRIPARPMLPNDAILRRRYTPVLGEFILNGKRSRGL